MPGCKYNHFYFCHIVIGTLGKYSTVAVMGSFTNKGSYTLVKFVGKAASNALLALATLGNMTQKGLVGFNVTSIKVAKASTVLNVT